MSGQTNQVLSSFLTKTCYCFRYDRELIEDFRCSYRESILTKVQVSFKRTNYYETDDLRLRENTGDSAMERQQSGCVDRTWPLVTESPYHQPL